MKKTLNPSGKKHRFGKAWMHEHVSDAYVREAQRLGYRSRSAFKLIELAERDKLFRRGMMVVDLGAAPGSWCQVLRERLGPQAKILAVDILPMTPLPGVTFVQTDFSKLPPYGNGTVRAGIRLRHIPNVNGMTVHVLETGYDTPRRPAVSILCAT